MEVYAAELKYGALRQINTITNIGKHDTVISGFSSAAITTGRGKVGVAYSPAEVNLRRAV